MTGSIKALSSLLAFTGICLVLLSCSSEQTAPGFEDLKNASYNGIDVGDVTLENGQWQGEPYSAGSPVAPRAGLANDFYLQGDLDADNRQEAVVLVWSSAGGTGSNSYLAVMEEHNDGIRNLANALVGDRVKVLGSEIQGDSIILHVLQAAEDDPMCCPTQLATRTWQLVNGLLKEGEPIVTGKHNAE